MQKVSPSIKLITCILAWLVIWACTLRLGFTFFRSWLPVKFIAGIPVLLLAASVLSSVVWLFKKNIYSGALAFWQGLICFGVSLDLATFGWEKIFRSQFVVPQSKLDLSFSSLSAQDMFWVFFSYSYPLACIIGVLQISGALLFLYHRTRLVGAFVLLPLLANILLFDIFYQIGDVVVVHTTIMLAGVLYFIGIEYNRLKEFFFKTKDQLTSVAWKKYLKVTLRLSVIFIPVLLLILRGNPDKDPTLTGKYAVQQVTADQQMFASIPSLLYFDVKNGFVLEFSSQQNRWYGKYEKHDSNIVVRWRIPADKTPLIGKLYSADLSSNLVLKGTSGKDSVTMVLNKIVQKKSE